VTPAEMAEVLAACSAYDSRTVGIVDVAAWHKAIGHLDKADALEAVAQHYATSRDRIMPADVNEECRRIRNERASSQPHEIRSIPSRFELEEIRDPRARAGIAACIAAIRIPQDELGDDPHSVALARARRERTTPAPAAPRRKTDGKAIDLAKIPGPAWANTEVRERESVAALHDIGRPCGRPACPNPSCRRRE
jgi:hypothetical protein